MGWMSIDMELRGQAIPQPGAIAPYLNGVFPDQTPGPSGTWEVVNAFPNLTFIDPVQLLEVPGQNNFLVASKTGSLWILENDPNTSSKTIFLDIEDHVYTADDCGLLGIAFHPEFGQAGSSNRGYLYVYYRYTTGAVDGEKAYLRLSRFELAAGAATIDPNTEYVLIQQYDQHRWHNGGGMFFGTDGFLYLTIGDEGGANDFFNTTQAIDKWLFGGLLRIDVDRDSTRSHPIRRQPISNASPPAGWPGTFTQGYFIPNDNPWQDSTGGILEEFYALGLRSPHRMSHDPLTGDIWVGDIGQGLREEVDKISRGDNLQWPYREGDIQGPKEQPDSLIGNDRSPVYSYGRQLGTSVIGGFVYRGARFPSLVGKYIFGDHTFRSVWTLEENIGGDPTITDLVSVPSEGVGTKNGISSFATDSEGEVYVLKLFGTNLDGGKIFKLQQNGIVADPPALLSQTGAFSDMASLTPASGITPYLPNATLWSDKAEKFRWVALPNDGAFDSPEEQVGFNAASEWDFPAGTVFIKHFELPIDEANPSLTRRLETRFFVLTADGRGYGVSYKWNEQGTDAILLSDGATEEVSIAQAGGGTYTQTWTYPSRQQCMTCHNDASQYVLGLKTHQLNGEVWYPSAGMSANQLSTWNSWGVFDTDIGAHTQYLKSFHISDSTASLENRVRSYIDANCAYCHRPNYVQGAFDARFPSPLENQNLINGLNISSSSIPGGVIIQPGSPAQSELWIRDQSSDGNQMPPLARDLVDATYIKVLEDWIYSLGEADTTAPRIPKELTLIGASGNTLTFSWNPSVDDMGVAGYRLYLQLGGKEESYTVPYSPFEQTFTVPNLLSDTTYQVRISAYDEAGNESARSEALPARTLSCRFSIENLLIQPISECKVSDGRVEVETNGSGLEFSLNGGSSFQSSPVFTGLAGGTYVLLARSLADSTCTLTQEFVILNPSHCPVCSPSPNLALGKEATQSSTYGDGQASLAVDGNTTGDNPWGDNANLQHTETDSAAWWKVDLDTLYNLDYVRIFNRTDFGGFKLSDFYLYLSEQDMDGELSHSSLQADAAISYIHFAETAGSEESISIGARPARYVMIKLSGSESLHMAEVEIYGCEIVSISDCGMRIDSVGVTSPGGCEQANGSIVVEAATVPSLSSQLIYSLDSGRTYQSTPDFNGLTSGTYYLFMRASHDASCELAYRDNPIVLSDTSSTRIWDIAGTPVTDCHIPNGSVKISATGEHLAYSLDGGVQFQESPNFYGLSKGTYSIVVRDSLNPSCQLEDTFTVESSALCDTLECEGGTNVALGKHTTQSSTYGDGISSLAVDGITTGSTPWGTSANLAHPQTSHDPWWKVDLGSIHSLDSLRIFNRSNCCTSRLRNFYVFVSSMDFDASQSIDSLLSDSSLTSYFFPGNASLLTSLQISEQEGRYLALKLPGESQTLHIAEFEVYGCRVEPTCKVQIDSLQVTHPTSCGLADGSVFIQASGDSLEYSIDGGVNFLASPTFSNLAAGTYSIFVREVQDTRCISSDTFSIQEISAPIFTSIESQGPSDCGIMDGSIQVQAIGDSLAYSIDGGLTFQESSLFQGLPQGDYEVYVREVLYPNCWTVANLSLIGPQEPAIDSLSTFHPSDCVSQDGYISILATGDSLEYSIDGGNSFQQDFEFAGLSGGSYSVVVREVLSPSCQVEAVVSLLSPVGPSIDSIAVSPISTCDRVDGSIHIVATGDSLEYSIDGGTSFQHSPLFTELDTGNYVVYVRKIDAIGCVDSLHTSLYDSTSCSSEEEEPQDCTEPINLALGKTATQSSTYGNGHAGIAVDGEIVGDSPWGDASLQHTQSENSPWWQVDLVNSAKLDSFRVFNRSDCCQGRLKNFYVFVSEDSLDGSRTVQELSADSTIASFFYPGNPGIQATVDLREVRGQFVMLKLGEGEESLHTSEIEVYGCYGGAVDTSCSIQIDSVALTPPSNCGVNDAQITVLASGEGLEYSIDGGDSFQYSTTFTKLRPGDYSVVVRKITQNACSVSEVVKIAPLPNCGGDDCSAPINLALGKATFQSSTYGNGLSIHAVDGLTTGFTPWGETADLQHTASEDGPWWKVDLGGMATLSEIQLFNRTNCCQNRLEDFYIFTSPKDIDGTKSVDSLITDPTIQYIYFPGRAGLVESIDLNQVQGQFLLLKLVGENKTLHTAEIEVYGCTASPSQRFVNPNEPQVWAQQGESLNARVQPNPFEGSTELHWDQKVEVEEVYITNTLGQQVWWGKGSDVGSLMIGEGLSRGVYWVHIQGVTETQIVKILKVN